jgi:hypothetical protein
MKRSLGGMSPTSRHHASICWVCVIFFARVVVSERLRRARRGVRGGAARGSAGPPRGVQGFGGSAPEFFLFSGRHIFADISGRHISGTT